MNRRIMFGAVALYLIGAVLHLDLFRQPPGTIWGDAGDGFFNLWVLNHSVETVSRGDWNVADGRIFWPHHEDTFFWSDNLLAAVPLFAFSRWIMPGLLDAFRLTGFLLSALQFGALLFLFHQIHMLVRDRYPLLSGQTGWLIPVFAYLAHFSPAVLINHFLHVQNLCSFGIFVLLGAMVAYQRRPAAGWLGLMAAALVFLLYSTPYYAVAGFVLLTAWLGFEANADARTLRWTAWRARWVLMILFVPAAMLAAAYFRVERVPYQVSDIKVFSLDWSHLFVPAYGYIEQLLRRGMAEYPQVHNEKIAWLGPGLLIGLVVLLGELLRRTKKAWRSWYRMPRFWLIAVSVALLFLKARELRPVLAWYGVLWIGASIVWCSRYLARRYQDDNIRCSAGYLVVGAVLMYGIAFGPHGYYLNTSVNPSVWGVLSPWVPGLSSMRAVGRMAFIGQVLLIALAALCVWVALARAEGARRRMVWAGVILLCVLQGLDVSTVRARQGQYDESVIRPTREEHAFFQMLHGSLVVIPAHPFPRNTVSMLYFSGYPELRLMNGYSARSTAVWDEVMDLERQYGPSSPEQVRYVVSRGVDYVAVRMDFIRAARAGWLVEAAGPPLFQNNRWMVYAAANMGVLDDGIVE